MRIPRMLSCFSASSTREKEACALRAALDQWEHQAPPGEQQGRAAARSRIERCHAAKHETLSLNQLGLSTLPEAFCNLPHLKHLELNENRITALPESFSKLPRLTSLSLYKNKLTTLPESLGQHPELTLLWLDDNSITLLPESIGNLPRLTGLFINNNELIALPDSIGNLTELVGLSLIGNALSALPESLGNLEKLTGLNLTDNRLRTLPDSIGKLAQLKRLSLKENLLTRLPESISQLTQLQKLLLNDNPLDATALPKSRLPARINFAIGTCLAAPVSGEPSPPANKHAALFRLNLALDQAIQQNLSRDLIRQIARALLDTADRDTMHFNLGGFHTLRDELEVLAGIHTQTEDAVQDALRRDFIAIQHGRGANAHMTGFVLSGARMLEELNRRNQGAMLPLAHTLAAITTSLATAEHDAQTARAVTKGLHHLQHDAQKILGDTNDLNTTPETVLRVLWTYIENHPDPSVQDNLRAALHRQLAQISEDEPCRTGCSQRLLQAPEGIDPSLISPQPDEAALRDEMQSFAGHLNNHLEDDANYADHRCEDARPDLVAQLKQDILRAHIEARFIRFRGLDRALVEKAANPVLEMVKDL